MQEKTYKKEKYIITIPTDSKPTGERMCCRWRTRLRGEQPRNIRRRSCPSHVKIEHPFDPLQRWDSAESKNM